MKPIIFFILFYFVFTETLTIDQTSDLVVDDLLYYSNTTVVINGNLFNLIFKNSNINNINIIFDNQTNIELLNNNFYNNTLVIISNNVNDLFIYNNTIYDNVFYDINTLNSNIYNNTIYNKVTFSLTSSSLLYIYNNIINNDISFTITTINLYIYNNSIYDIIYYNINTLNSNIYNNTIYNEVTFSIISPLLSYIYNNTINNNNTFTITTNDSYIYNNNIYDNIAYNINSLNSNIYNNIIYNSVTFNITSSLSYLYNNIMNYNISYTITTIDSYIYNNTINDCNGDRTTNYYIFQVTLSNNSYFYNNPYITCSIIHPILFYQIYNGNGDNNYIYLNPITVLPYSDPFIDVLTYDRTPHFENIYPNIVSNSSTLTSFLLGYNNYTINNVNITNNSYQMNYTTNHELFTPITFGMDNFIHVHNYSSIITFNLYNNSISSNNTINSLNQSINAFVRGGILLLGGNVNDTLRQLNESTTLEKSYQYIAREYMRINPNIKAYQMDIEIEPDANDEFDVWGYDLCHYSCKQRCEECILTDSTQLPREFSSYTHGSCYNKTFSEDLAKSVSQCGHYYLYVRGKFISNQTVFFATNNRINNSISIKPANINDIIIIKMTNVLNVPDEYKTVFNPTFPTTDPSFDLYHPFIFLNKYKNVELKNIKFEGIQFQLEYQSAFTNNLLFSSVIYSPSSITQLDEIIFYNCSFSGINLNAIQLPTDSTTFHLFEFISSVPNFASSIYLKKLTLEDCEFDNFGKIFRGKPFIEELFLNHDQFSFIMDGWMNLNVYEAKINAIQCLQCLPDSLDNSILNINGYQTDISSYITSSSYTSTLLVDNSGATRAFSVTNFTNIFLGDLSTTVNSAGSVSYGLYFKDLINLPCDSISLALLKGINTNISGSVADISCELPFLSCLGDMCFLNSSYIPPDCIVDKTYSSLGFYYRLHYFHTIQDAINLCKAVSPKNFYIYQDLYTENLEIKNIGLNESLIFNGNGTVIIIGSNHLISQQISTVFIGVTLNNIILFNPTGVETFVDTLDDYILYNILTIHYFELYNVKIIGFIPLTSLTLPTNVSEWGLFEDMLLNKSDIHPNIRKPNHFTSISLLNSGKTVLNNVSFYGSQKIGFMETKNINEQETNIQNIYGENQWGGLFSFSGMNNFTLINLTCNYFCNGFSNLSQYSTIYMNMIEGIYFKMDNIELIDEQLPSGNIYNPNTRFIVGDPFRGYGDINIGYLSQFWISGLKSNTYQNISLRNINTNGFPIGGRISDSDRTALILNDNGNVLYEDNKVLLRQIQYSNNINLNIKGSLYDLRYNTPTFDVITTDSSLYCNGLCPPDTPLTYCKVGSNLTLSSTQYNTINNALRYCPYNRILLIDTLYNENINYTFPNTRFSIPSTTLLLLSFVNSVINGKHIFTSTCNGLNEITPDIFTIQGITFETQLISNENVIELANGGCVLPNIIFDTNTFNINSSSLYDTMKIIDCNLCYINNLNFTNNIFNNQSNNIIGIYFYPSTLGSSIISIYNSLTNKEFGTFLYIKDSKGFDISLNYILCIDTTTACVLIDGSNLLGNTHKIYKNTLIGQNSINPTTYSGIRWNLDQILTLSDIEIILRQTTLNIISGNALQITITALNLMSYYPCVDSDITYIYNFSLDNPSVSTLHRFVWSEPDLSILPFAGKRSDCLIFDYLKPDYNVYTYLFISYGISVGIFLFCFFCCGGFDLLQPMEGWITTYYNNRNNDNLLNKKNV